MDWHSVIAQDYPTAVRAIQRMLPATLKATHDAEDFVQQALCDLIGKPIDYRGEKTLIVLARRRMIDAIRRPKQQPLTDELVDDQADSSPSAAEQTGAAELLEQLLDRTDDSARELVRLRADGHTPQEIALLTGRGLRTVQRFFKLFKALHEPY
jgi:RNA polymerase sigma factor (sigma-70 family)